MPTWPITVPQELYDAVAETVDEPYADSYLWGALLHDGKLTPRTVTAWERLKLNRAVMDAMRRLGVEMLKPKPFGSPGGSQRSGTEVSPELAPSARGRRPAHDAW